VASFFVVREWKHETPKKDLSDAPVLSMTMEGEDPHTQESTPETVSSAKTHPAPNIHPHAGTPTPGRRTSTQANKASCTPPYEVDSTGVKVYKRECFATGH
jgi:hypothetical protein